MTTMVELDDSLGLPSAKVSLIDLELQGPSSELTKKCGNCWG